jgi:hypothetical protein
MWEGAARKKALPLSGQQMRCIGGAKLVRSLSEKGSGNRRLDSMKMLKGEESQPFGGWFGYHLPCVYL